jgi:hypothetical protein
MPPNLWDRLAIERGEVKHALLLKGMFEREFANQKARFDDISGGGGGEKMRSKQSDESGKKPKDPRNASGKGKEETSKRQKVETEDDAKKKKDSNAQLGMEFVMTEVVLNAAITWQEKCRVHLAEAKAGFAAENGKATGDSSADIELKKPVELNGVDDALQELELIKSKIKRMNQNNSHDKNVLADEKSVEKTHLDLLEAARLVFKKGESELSEQQRKNNHNGDNLANVRAKMLELDEAYKKFETQQSQARTYTQSVQIAQKNVDNFNESMCPLLLQQNSANCFVESLREIERVWDIRKAELEQNAKSLQDLAKTGQQILVQNLERASDKVESAKKKHETTKEIFFRNSAAMMSFIEDILKTEVECRIDAANMKEQIISVRAANLKLGETESIESEEIMVKKKDDLRHQEMKIKRDEAFSTYKYRFRNKNWSYNDDYTLDSCQRIHWFDAEHVSLYSHTHT